MTIYHQIIYPPGVNSGANITKSPPRKPIIRETMFLVSGNIGAHNRFNETEEADLMEDI